MGWFWADTAPKPAPAAPNPLPKADATPPPGCPMNTSSTPSTTPSTSTNAQGSCPVKPSNSPFGESLPISSQPDTTPAPPSENSSTLSKLNPLNYMFANISQSRAENQTVDLPVERERSSIPRSDPNAGNWEYPSPQQMYNAMLRKGHKDTPQDAVEAMVAVHNFLNEGAWAEIVEWEQLFAGGLKNGWEKCRRGEENLKLESERRQQLGEDGLQPRLVRFMGRPGDLTPKARILQAMGWVYPARFGTEPPFDRHDWFVSRKTPSGEKEVRYVIDFYSGPPEPSGSPVFYLDIRPAVDTPSAAIERMMKWGGDVWWRASGGAAREASS